MGKPRVYNKRPRRLLHRLLFIINRDNLCKIGIGTWGIGGFAKRDPNNNDQCQIKALVYSLKKGQNLVEVNFWNAEGYSIELIRRSIRQAKIPRDNIFIVQAIYHYNLDTLKDVEKEFNLCLENFETQYVDSLEFPQPSFRKFGFKNLTKLVDKYLSEGKIRYTSLTNCNLEFLKKYHRIFKDKLFSHELCYSFEIRENEVFGITDYALGNNIINVPFQPLKRNRTAKRSWPLLVELSNKYNKTQNQIILNWIISSGFYPLVKSETISHIDENFGALGFTIEQEDLDRLNAFRVPGYKIPKIDWWMVGDGIAVHMLPNVFDELYPNNK